MTTATRMIGPADEGLAMTWEDFSTADWKEGYRYELIDGRLVVAAAPNINHARYWQWLNWPLANYVRLHSEIVNFLACQARVFIPNRRGATVPEPDFAAYQNFPDPESFSDEINWRKVSPILVVEIISPDTADKDFVRNVELYEAVQSIREYWIVDGRNGAENMTFRVYRKRGSKWQKPIDLGYGDTYTTKLLPDFSLLIDPLA